MPAPLTFLLLITSILITYTSAATTHHHPDTSTYTITAHDSIYTINNARLPYANMLDGVHMNKHVEQTPYDYYVLMVVATWVA